MMEANKTETCREAFEKWAFTAGHELKQTDDGYVSLAARVAWQSWQAAWQARTSTPAVVDEGLVEALKRVKDLLQKQHLYYLSDSIALIDEALAAIQQKPNGDVE